MHLQRESSPVGFAQKLRRGMHQIVVIAVQHFLQRHLDSHSRPDAIQNAIDVAHPAGLHNVFDVRQRPGIRIVRRIPAHVQPRTFEAAKRKGVTGVVNLHKNRGMLSAALALHPLRQSFLNPGRRMNLAAGLEPHASAPRLLRNEAVGELMFEDARQFPVDACQSLHRHADASIVQRSGPRRRPGDIAEGVLRVENHPD